MKRPIAAIMATGRGIPERVMTNHDFASIGIETSHEWIVERSGIVERHLASETETTASMAAAAAHQAMERAGVHPGSHLVELSAGSLWLTYPIKRVA